MNGRAIRRLDSRWLTLATLAFCTLYVCQAIPHAHSTDDLAPQPEVVQPNHSHSSSDHHHHHHDPAPEDDRSHHHHALSWHIDLHFGRLLGEKVNLTVDDGPAAPIDLGTVPDSSVLTTGLARDVAPGEAIPLAHLEPRGPPRIA